MSETWWYAQGTQRLGPVPQATLQSLIDTGVVGRDTLVWAEGMGQWQAAHTVPAWAQHFVMPPPLPPEPPPLPAAGVVPAPMPVQPPPISAPSPAAPPAAAAASTPWAPYPRRVAAGLIDLALVIAVAVLLPGLAWRDAALWIDRSSISFPPIVLSVTATLAYVLYHAVMLSQPGEATLGKRLLGLRVTDEAGARLTFWRAAGRTLAHAYSILPLGIGLLMPLWTQRRQALHDKVASTLVVNTGHAGWPPAQPASPRLQPWQAVALGFALPLNLAVDLYDTLVYTRTHQTAERLYQAAQTTARQVAQEFEASGQVIGRGRHNVGATHMEIEANTGVVTALDASLQMQVRLVPSGQRGPVQWSCTVSYERLFSPPGNCNFRRQ